MAAIDDVEAKVAASRTVQESAVVLLNQLTQMIKDAGTDPARLRAVVDQIQANTDALAAAIVANTPAEGQPPTAP